jgi:hypothetical protein
LRETIGLLTSLANGLIGIANIVPGVNIGSIPNIAPSAAEVPQLSQSRNAVENRTTNITIQGAVDPVSTARQVANIITFEASTAGSFSRFGTSRLGRGD